MRRQQRGKPSFLFAGGGVCHRVIAIFQVIARIVADGGSTEKRQEEGSS
jgi:hypothetical protein